MNILNKLTIKHLAMNKRRTIVTIVGIILSTALMVGIGLLVSTMREMMIEDIIASKGDYNTAFVDVKKYNVSKVKNNVNVNNFEYRQKYGYAKISDSIDDYYKLYGADEAYLKHLKITEGRLPINNNEVVVPNHVINDHDLKIKVGDTITLNLGERKDKIEIDDALYSPTEYIDVTTTKTLKVVGIIEKDIYEGDSLGYNLFTTLDNGSENLVDIIVSYKNPKDTYKISENIAKTMKFKLDSKEYRKQVIYNDSLLSMYGASKYQNFMSALMGMLSLMLGLVSIACIVVIYNSFAISVMERKKQFGLFSSIGATKKQLRRTVLFEALIVGLIGIPLGILSAYIGIGIVIMILNKLVGPALIGGIKFRLITYPLFLVIPVIFMFITILVSAFLPARRASKISPIEAIRLNDDIKIRGKKVKTPKIIKKLFGVEGDVALKNMKRNKKKYRITIVSLVICIVLFISFSAYLKYTLASAYDYVQMPKFDIQVSYKSNTPENVLSKIENNKDVKDSIRFKMLAREVKANYNQLYTEKFNKYLKKYDYNMNNQVSYIFVIGDKYYEKYLEKIGKEKEEPILYNRYSGIVYEKDANGKSSRKSFNFKRYNENTNEIIHLKQNNSDKEIDIKDYYVSDIGFLSSEMFEEQLAPVIAMSESMYNTMFTDKIDDEFMMLKAPNYTNVKKIINDYIDAGSLDKEAYLNVNEQMKLISNLMLAIKILVYGFIALVTLIGVTSVFNTINTSIQLRRKEFAVLRSIGLSPKGFTKMLCLESLFFGIKSILYGLPISFIIILFMSKSMGELVSSEHILIPWGSIIIAIFGVFIVVGISMIYSTRKIKNENILEAIRKENI